MAEEEALKFERVPYGSSFDRYAGVGHTVDVAVVTIVGQGEGKVGMGSLSSSDNVQYHHHHQEYPS